MSFIQNINISEEYGVAASTVSLWIMQSLKKKNALQIELDKDGKWAIIDNENNHSEMARLKEKNRKYIKKSFHADVEPDPEFYKIFSEDEIVEIINLLKTKKEIPVKYASKNPQTGEIWTKHFNKNILNKKVYTHTYSETQAVKQSMDFIKEYATGYTKINLIDISPYNPLVVAEIAKELKNINKLGKYIAVDIGESMPKMAIEEIKKIVPDIETMSYITDFEKKDLGRFLAENKTETELNLVMVITSNIGNAVNKEIFLNTLREGLDSDDLLMACDKVYWDNIDKVSYKSVNLDEIIQIDTYVARVLGIYQPGDKVIGDFDSNRGSNIYSFRTSKNYTLNFNLFGKTQTLNLDKGTEIVIFKHKPELLLNFIGDFMNKQFKVLHLTTFKDLCMIITKAWVKRQ